MIKNMNTKIDYWDFVDGDLDISDPEYDEVAEKSLRDLNSDKSMAPLFIKEILEDHSDFAHPLTIAQIGAYLMSRPYEVESIDRKAIARCLRTLNHFGYDVHKNDRGFYIGNPARISTLALAA